MMGSDCEQTWDVEVLRNAFEWEINDRFDTEEEAAEVARDRESRYPGETRIVKSIYVSVREEVPTYEWKTFP